MKSVPKKKSQQGEGVGRNGETRGGDFFNIFNLSIHQTDIT